MPNTTIPESHIGILETAKLALVSTIRHKDGLISTNPVGFDWDGEFVRISTLKARVKYNNLVANPQITFCVVDPVMPTRYIEIRGQAEISEDPDSTLAKKLMGQEGEGKFALDDDGAERVIVKIVPLQVSTPKLYGGVLDQPVDQRQ